MERTAEQPQRDEAQPKEPYSAPRLITHGPIEKITLAIGAFGFDGIIGSTITIP